MGNISLKKGQVLKASTVHFYPNFHLAVPPPSASLYPASRGFPRGLSVA